MKRNLSTVQKLLATTAVVATAGALTAGAFASWQSTQSQHQDIGAATVTSTFTSQLGGAWDDVDVSNVLPGDSVVRYAALTNTGSIQQTFTVNVKGSTGDLTAAEDGLRVGVSSCTVPWVDGECTEGVGGTPLASSFITDSGVTTAPIVLASTAHTYLRVAFVMNASAADSFQGQLDKFQVVETGTPTDHGDTLVPTDVSASPSS
jgi:hypothetical protein